MHGPFKKHSFLIGAMALIACPLTVYNFYPAEAANEKAAPPQQDVLIRVAPATQENVPVQIQTIGTILPYQTVAVKSRLDSVIADVKFKDGDTVKAGDVLFQLDDRALKTQYDEAKANLTRDQVQLTNLRQKLDRNKTLAKDNLAISRETLDDSRAAVDSQNAMVQADKAQLDNLEVQLSYTQIKAPIDGRTGTINITAGNTVKSNDTIALVTINQIHPILIQVSLPQQYFDVVRQSLATGGVSATAKREKSDKISTGQLTYIDNTVDAASGTFVARAAFANEDESLWPGMLANLSLNVGEAEGVITIPDVGVQDSATGKFVYVITDMTAKKTPVEIDRIDQGKAIIRKGLNKGDQVAIDGIMSLKDGAKVKIANTASATPPQKTN